MDGSTADKQRAVFDIESQNPVRRQQPCTHKKGGCGFTAILVEDTAITGIGAVTSIVAGEIAKDAAMGAAGAAAVSGTFFATGVAVTGFVTKMIQAAIPSYRQPGEGYSTSFTRLVKEDGYKFVRNTAAALTSACTVSAIQSALASTDPNDPGNVTTAAMTTPSLTTDDGTMYLDTEMVPLIVGAGFAGIAVHYVTTQTIRAVVTLANKYFKPKEGSKTGTCFEKSEGLSCEGAISDAPDSFMGLVPDLTAGLMVGAGLPVGIAIAGQLTATAVMTGTKVITEKILRQLDRKKVLLAIDEAVDHAPENSVRKFLGILSKVTQPGLSRDEIRSFGKEVDKIAGMNLTGFSEFLTDLRKISDANMLVQTELSTITPRKKRGGGRRLQRHHNQKTQRAVDNEMHQIMVSGPPLRPKSPTETKSPELEVAPLNDVDNTPPYSVKTTPIPTIKINRGKFLLSRRSLRDLFKQNGGVPSPANRKAKVIKPVPDKKKLRRRVAPIKTDSPLSNTAAKLSQKLLDSPKHSQRKASFRIKEHL